MSVINELEIESVLQEAIEPSPQRLQELLGRAIEKKGLNLFEVSELLQVGDAKMLEEMFAASGKIKREIYGRRLVFFAPIYLSNLCENDCAYCGFKRSNPVARKKLSLEEVEEQK